MPVLIFARYFQWHFIIMPLEILKGWKNIFLFAVNYFSLPLLLKTLFSPWRRITWQGAKGFDFSAFFENLAGNFMSRILGFLIRLAIVAAGLLGLSIVILGGIGAFLSWIALPAAILFSLLYGFTILF
ncbi:MAG: hypothetical protein HYS60_03070 [Candidatus Wildermuthbacteria bacterium]|nr:hypothetical protein [Candidatus Wildermuthbacteria bacterium]